MKLKLKYLSLLLLLAINSLNAKIPSLEEIENKEEYKLIIDYRKNTCPFIDENTNYKTQNYCFHIVNRLYELTDNEIFLYSIAKHYFKGYGVTQNLKKGLELMEKLANSDHENAIQAQSTLGIYYGADYKEDDPRFAVKDPIKEEYWTKKAAENGDPLSQYFYARILLKSKGQFNDAIFWYKKAADNGSVEAKNKLGELFNERYSMPIEKKQIYQFLKEAAEQNYEPAFQELYLLYYQDGDCEKAKFWYNKFINSDYFKKFQAGIDPDTAIIEIFMEQEKKKYVEKVRKEIEEIEKQSIKKKS